MANVTKQASTRFSIVKRSKGQSAVEKASYISRSILVSEFDGQTYRPKYHEDLRTDRFITKRLRKRVLRKESNQKKKNDKKSIRFDGITIVLSL